MSEGQRDLQGSLRQLAKFLKIFYGVMLGAVALYWVVLYQATLKGSNPPNAKFREGMIATAAFDAALALYFRFVRIPKLTAAGQHLSAGTLAKIRSFHIISAVLALSVALTGFALAFVTGLRKDALPYLAAGAILLILFFPRASQDEWDGTGGLNG